LAIPHWDFSCRETFRNLYRCRKVRCSATLIRGMSILRDSFRRDEFTLTTLQPVTQLQHFRPRLRQIKLCCRTELGESVYLALSHGESSYRDLDLGIFMKNLKLASMVYLCPTHRGRTFVSRFASHDSVPR